MGKASSQYRPCLNYSFVDSEGKKFRTSKLNQIDRFHVIKERTGKFIEVISNVIRLEIVVGVFVVNKGHLGFGRWIIQNVPQQQIIVGKHNWTLYLFDS